MLELHGLNVEEKGIAVNKLEWMMKVAMVEAIFKLNLGRMCLDQEMC